MNALPTTQPTGRQLLRAVAMPMATSMLAVTLLANVASAAVIEVTSSDDLVNPGESFDITVAISGLGDGVPPSLGTYDLSLVFDPAVFELSTGTLMVSDFLGDEGGGEALVTITEGPSDVDVVVVSLLTPAQLTGLQGDSFELFTATFTGVGFGDGIFDVVANGPLGDKNGTVIPLDEVIPVIVPGGTILDIPTAGTVGLTLMAALLLGAGFLLVRRVV